MHSTRLSRGRVFSHVLVNTTAASLAAAFLWFGLTFWAYLQTRSVLATSLMSGAFLLGRAVLGVPFGGLIDRHHKHTMMLISAVGTTVLFLVGAAVYLVVPSGELTRLDRPWFWLFAGLILAGVLLENIRSLALATCVTILIEPDKRANANGLVGMTGGLTMLVTGVFSGLSIGLLGIGWTLVIAVVVILVSLTHLMSIRIPEPAIVHAEGAPKAVDFKGAWAAVVAVPGLFGLILFSTFNNFLGGIFSGLLDPYGLELLPVQAWGLLFGLTSIGFIVGGALIAKSGLGRHPMRALLWACIVMWLVGIFFTIRESVPLLAAGLFVYMLITPYAEAAEQTMLQRLVPLDRQGRVFGFAQAVEVAASPVSSFVIGPVAQFWLIPYASSPAGRSCLGWLLGQGNARGIALTFVCAGLIGLVVTVGAFASRSYRLLSDAYTAGEGGATG